jgi:hypothetical protein
VRTCFLYCAALSSWRYLGDLIPTALIRIYNLPPIPRVLVLALQRLEALSRLGSIYKTLPHQSLPVSKYPDCTTLYVYPDRHSFDDDYKLAALPELANVPFPFVNRSTIGVETSLHVPAFAPSPPPVLLSHSVPDHPVLAQAAAPSFGNPALGSSESSRLVPLLQPQSRADSTSSLPGSTAFDSSLALTSSASSTTMTTPKLTALPVVADEPAVPQFGSESMPTSLPISHISSSVTPLASSSVNLPVTLPSLTALPFFAANFQSAGANERSLDPRAQIDEALHLERQRKQVEKELGLPSRSHTGEGPASVDGELALSLQHFQELRAVLRCPEIEAAGVKYGCIANRE